MDEDKSTNDDAYYLLDKYHNTTWEEEILDVWGEPYIEEFSGWLGKD